MFKKLKKMIVDQLTQGVHPRGLAMGCSLATGLATFPILGSTTFLCFITATIFKLNQPLMQVVNYLFYPLQFLLLPVYLRIGEYVLGSAPFELRPLEMLDQLKSDFGLFMQNYIWAGLHAILGWSLVAPLIMLILYYILAQIFSRIKRNVNAQERASGHIS